jgi:hypothetical protein
VGTVLLSGCTARQESGEENTARASGTASPASEPSPSATSSPSPPRSVRRHDFWVSNRTGTDDAVEVSLARAGSDEAVLDGCYESPDGLAVRFRDVGVEGVTYDVRARIVGGGTVEARWRPSACPAAYSGLYGADGGLVIDGGSMAFARNECDCAAVGNELPEVPPENVEPCSEPPRSFRA